MSDDIEAARLNLLAVGDISRAMKKCGMTQRALGEAAGYAQSYVCAVLNGDRQLSLKGLAAFGRAVGIRWNVTSRRSAP